MFIGSGYILVLDIICQQLGKYSDIGYILPTIGRYILVLDIFCQQLGGYILMLDIFCQQLVDKCQLWGVCAPFGRRVADCAFTSMCIFLKKNHILQPYTRQLTYIPIPPIVGRIYPIPIYKFNLHIFSNCWQNISNTNI